MNDGSIFLLLIFMFFLGVVQVLWALLQVILTQNPNVRRHFAFYGVGVAVYFILLYVMLVFASMQEDNPILHLHFFGSAFALASYHVFIVVLSVKERNALLDAQEFQNREMPFEERA